MRCEICYQGSYVGSAAAGELEGGGLPGWFRASEPECVDRYRARFTFDADALAVEFVESGASAFQGRGHGWYLEEVARKGRERVVDGILWRERCVEGRDFALCVQRV